MTEDIVAQRQKAFLQFIAGQGLAAAALGHPHHIFYLSGFLPSTRALWATPPPASYLCVSATEGRFVLLVAEELVEYARHVCHGMTILSYRPQDVGAETDVTQALERGLGPLVAGERTGADLRYLDGMAHARLAKEHECVDIHAGLLQLESANDALAIAALRRNIALHDVGFAAAQAAIRPGVTEIEVYAAISRQMTVAGGCPFLLVGCFASGPRAASEIGGHPSGRPLGAGDLFIVDLFPTIDGYRADTTRTFVVGEPSEAQLLLHSILEQALRRAASVIRPGLPCAELDAVVRDSVASSGYGSYFIHHTGHGVGLFTPQPPCIDRISTNDCLRTGQVIAVEPGIYLPGGSGLRLEEDFLVTAEGCEALSGFPHALTVCSC